MTTEAIVEELKNKLFELEENLKNTVKQHNNLREKLERYFSAMDTGKVYDFQIQDLRSVFEEGYYINE